MTSTITKTNICNLALDILHEGPFTDVDADNTANSRWFVRNYEVTRDAEVRKHVWNFAKKRSTLTVDGAAPTFGWSYRYAIPSDCLRVLKLRYDGEFENPSIRHEVEAGYILCDQATSLYLLYIFQITDTTKFDPNFVEALAARLAMKAAHRFTGKQSMVQVAASFYADAIAEARLTNAIEGTPERPYDDDVIAARYST